MYIRHYKLRKSKGERTYGYMEITRCIYNKIFQPRGFMVQISFADIGISSTQFNQTPLHLITIKPLNMFKSRSEPKELPIGRTVTGNNGGLGWKKRKNKIKIKQDRSDIVLLFSFSTAASRFIFSFSPSFSLQGCVTCLRVCPTGDSSDCYQKLRDI